MGRHMLLFAVAIAAVAVEAWPSSPSSTHKHGSFMGLQDHRTDARTSHHDMEEDEVLTGGTISSGGIELPIKDDWPSSKDIFSKDKRGDYAGNFVGYTGDIAKPDLATVSLYFDKGHLTQVHGCASNVGYHPEEGVVTQRINWPVCRSALLRVSLNPGRVAGSVTFLPTARKVASGTKVTATSTNAVIVCYSITANSAPACNSDNTACTTGQITPFTITTATTVQAIGCAGADSAVSQAAYTIETAEITCASDMSNAAYTAAETQLNIATGFNVGLTCATGYASVGTPTAVKCTSQGGAYTYTDPCVASTALRPALHQDSAASPALVKYVPKGYFCRAGNPERSMSRTMSFRESHAADPEWVKSLDMKLQEFFSKDGDYAGNLTNSGHESRNVLTKPAGDTKVSATGVNNDVDAPADETWNAFAARKLKAANIALNDDIDRHKIRCQRRDQYFAMMNRVKTMDGGEVDRIREVLRKRIGPASETICPVGGTACVPDGPKHVCTFELESWVNHENL